MLPESVKDFGYVERTQIEVKGVCFECADRGKKTKPTISIKKPDFREPPRSIEGAADHWNHRKDSDDYYSQPGNLFRVMSPAQQKVLFENTVRAMGDAAQEIKIRHISY